MIDQDTIERVRQSTGISALVGESVKLQRRGRSHVGLCPFHKEKTPSFHVNEERGIYHCFGCGVTGDVFKFVQHVEGLSFVEAVRRLADRAGIAIVENVSDAERREQAIARRRLQELYDLNQVAASYFERLLREHPLRHLAEAELARRGLVRDSATSQVADTLQAFRVGYAPYGWDGLAQHLKDLGLGHQAAEKIGLLVPRRTGSGHYDRFRHRLMFAVMDLQGRVIAFSGRALEEPSDDDLRRLGLTRIGDGQQAPAKYLNSPESSIYKKREAVFGLYQARQALHEAGECVLVEGNFDVVSLHARGVRNVVAPLGTSFTLEQARQIKRFAASVTLLFDGDAAGRRATEAARPVCQQAALVAKVASLPNGVDPDDWVRTHGPDGLRRVVQAARGMLEHLIDVTLSSSFAADDARTRANKVDQVIALLASEDDPTVRALAEQHADKLAERLNISDARTFRALTDRVRQGLRGDKPAPEAVAPPPHRARSRNREQEIAREIFGAMLDYPELFDTPEGLSGAQVLEGDYAAALVALRQSRLEAGMSAMGDPEQLLAKLPPSIHSFAAARLAAPRHLRLEDAKNELLANVTKLKRLELKRQKAAVMEDLQRAARAGNFDEELVLLREHLRRARERHGLG